MSKLKTEVLSSQCSPFSACETKTFKAIAASVCGQSHQKNEQECQDAYLVSCARGRALAVVSDGAGSKPLSAYGSKIACITLMKLFHDGEFDKILHNTSIEQLEELFAFGILQIRKNCELFCSRKKHFGLDTSFVESWTKRKDNKASLKCVGATVAACLWDKDVAYLVHIGDGLMGALSKDGNYYYSPPENGGYSNLTYFFSDDNWREHLRISTIKSPAWVILMSDGVTSFSTTDGTNFEKKFILPAVNYFENNDLHKSASLLFNTLDCREVRSIDDDDKTFVWLKKK